MSAPDTTADTSPPGRCRSDPRPDARQSLRGLRRTHPERRSKAISANYTDDVIWTDPDGTTQGRQALNERAQKLIDRSPHFVFSAAGPVHVSRDLGLLAFNLGVPERPPAVSGIDVALVRDGRIAVLHTILTAKS